jgi:hypothetical protein
LFRRSARGKRETSAQELLESSWQSSGGTGPEPFAIVGHERTVMGIAQRVGLFEDRVEHRCQVPGRRIDDLQYLGGRGLLLQRLPRLGQEPRVFHRDDRLCGEVLQ